MFLLRSLIGYCRVGLQLSNNHPFTTRVHNRPNVRSDTLSQCLRYRRGPYGYLGDLIKLSRPAQWLKVESMLSASLARCDCATRATSDLWAWRFLTSLHPGYCPLVLYWVCGFHHLASLGWLHADMGLLHSATITE